MGGRIRHRRPDQVPPRALPGARRALPRLVPLDPRVRSPAPLPEVAQAQHPVLLLVPVDPARRRLGRHRRHEPERGRLRRDSQRCSSTLHVRHPRHPHARRWAPATRACDSCCGHRRARMPDVDGSGAEGLVPERRARVVVDRDHVVVAGHDRQRREQRDAVDGDALHGGLHAPLAFEFGFPLQLEAGLRERVDRDVRIGPQPVRALRVALRGRPFVADIASLREERDGPD